MINKKRKYLPWLAVLLPLMSHPAVASQDENISFNDLALECAPHVSPATLQAITRTESAFNPYAIGVVGGSVKQPQNFADAVQTAKELHEAGKNFSMGLAQINKYNLAKYGLNYESVFDPCLNLKTGADILAECFSRAPGADKQESLQRALSCYYSGNFRTGFTHDLKGQPSYVERIVNNALRNSASQTIKVKAQEPEVNKPAQVVPAIDTTKAVATVTARKSSSPVKVKAKTVAAVDPTTAAPKERSANKSSWDAFGDW